MLYVYDDDNDVESYQSKLMLMNLMVMKLMMVTLITVLPSPCKARLATSGEFAVKRSDGADEV